METVASVAASLEGVSAPPSALPPSADATPESAEVKFEPLEAAGIPELPEPAEAEVPELELPEPGAALASRSPVPFAKPVVGGNG